MSLDLIIVGLSLSSSWGNGHATSYRSLIPGLVALGHRVHFLERQTAWYAARRDLAHPTFCELEYYDSVPELDARFGSLLRRADAVIIGSYVPGGIEVIDRVAALLPRQLSFYDIDTPVTLAKLERGEEEYIARRQVPLFDTYFSFSGGPTLARLEHEFGARRALPLYCSVDPKMYAPTGEEIRWDLGYLGTYSKDRQETLEKLLIEPARRLPEMRFVVAGPMYPDTIVWPPNVDHIEHLPPAQHASFYSRQRFTLNVTRADMISAGWSPSVRLFEAAAAGVPIISDIWPGLTELFPSPRAIRLARDTDDVVTALTEVTSGERRAMAEAAQRIVLQDHTGLARAGQLIDGLINTTSRPAPNRATSITEEALS
jgi:spore maturation protein CgeB